MHPVDIHKRAVSEANAKTFDKFSTHGPYRPGSEEHQFWLEVYDDVLRAHYS